MTYERDEQGRLYRFDGDRWESVSEDLTETAHALEARALWCSDDV